MKRNRSDEKNPCSCRNHTACSVHFPRERRLDRVRKCHAKSGETIGDADVASEAMNKAVVINTNVTQKPVETITDTDIASEAMNMEKATYHLLLDIGFTEEEAFMLLFFDSVTESGEVHESVYAEHEFE